APESSSSPSPSSPVSLCSSATAATASYTLSLHDALPIYGRPADHRGHRGSDPDLLNRPALGWGHGEDLRRPVQLRHRPGGAARQDRKSTRLNSSHVKISYAVFCLKKKRTDHSPSALPSSR